ncbi:hypothetical protein OSTOST_17793, partial [Ostertagia ostertagi]
CIKGGSRYYSETLSTLQFAAACRKIENRVHANEDLSGDTVMAYKEEITRLREELNGLEANIRSEMTAKLALVENELKTWKEAAISREKDLVEARLRCNLLSAQLTSGPSVVGDVKSSDEAIRAITAQLSRRIESIRTFEDLSRAQLEANLVNAYNELEEMRSRLENAEASRKASVEKYNGFLQGCSETSISELSLRRLNLTTVCFISVQPKFVELWNKFCLKAPEEFDALDNGDVVEDGELAEEYESLRLEMENNRLSQIICEKETAIKSICELQKQQAAQWAKEKQEFLRADSLLKSRNEHLESENNTLREKLEKYRKKAEQLGVTISSFNDERCRLQQQIDGLHSEKLDLEDQLQALQNEQELMSNRMKNELVTGKPDAGVELAREGIKKLLCDVSEKRIVEKKRDLRKGKCNGLNFETMYQCEPVSYNIDILRLIRHFATYRNTIEDSFDHKLSELRATFFDSEKRTAELSTTEKPCKEYEAVEKNQNRELLPMDSHLAVNETD